MNISTERRSLLTGLAMGGEAMAGEGRAQGLAGILFSQDPDGVELFLRRGLSLELCGALTGEGGRDLLGWARRVSQAHVFRGNGMAGKAPAIRSALAREELSGLALFPILGERSVLGYFLLGIPTGPEKDLSASAEVRAAWESVTRWLEALRRDAGMAALHGLLDLNERGLGQGVEGILVLDAEDRVLFSHGMSRTLPAWGRGEVVGQALKTLPGGRVLSSMDVAGSGHLDWRTRKVPLAGEDLSLPLASLPLRLPQGEWLPWRAVLVGGRGGGQRGAGGSILAEIALRLTSGGTGRDRTPADSGAEELARKALELADRAQGEEAINLSGLFRGFLHRTQPELHDDRIRVLPFLAEDLPLVRGDRRILETALWAMLRQSWDALRVRGGTITLRTWEEEGSVWCTISHDGEGRDDQAMLDLLSLQPLPGTSGSGPVPGNGLSLAKTLLRRAGGTLHMEARGGLWTRYSVVFPAERVVDSSRNTEAPGMPPAVEVRRRADGQMAVLVVDDNQMVRTVLRKFLEKRGHEVMEAVDGGAALEILQGRAFDRVMVDIDMPGTSGVEFFQALDSVNPLMRERTVFMTGGFQEPETEEFIQGTGRPHLQKPFDLREIGEILTC